MRRLSLLLAASVVEHTACFYLPGVAPREYLDGERVDVKVNKLTSTVTQLPFGYYTLPLCKPTELKYHRGRSPGSAISARAAPLGDPD